MSICKNCNSYFPVMVMIDGKEHNLSSRKYCLLCSPFGKHRTRPIEKDTSVERICKRCTKLYFYDHGRGNNKNFCGSCRTTRARQLLKLKAIAYLGGSCQKCGYGRSIRALCFHHWNHDDKSFTISCWTRLGWEIIKKELDKCVLLCANCHAEEHDKELYLNGKEIV